MKLFGLILGTLVICSCSPVKEGNITNQQESRTNVPIRVTWDTKECGVDERACTKTYVNECNINTPDVRSWGDTPNLSLLGHEFLHCLGVQHGQEWRY